MIHPPAAPRLAPPRFSSRDFPFTRGAAGAAALLCIALVAAYATTLRAPFVYDDVESIAGNPAIRHLWPFGHAATTTAAGGFTTAGRPVLALSLALNYAISGDNPWSYHVGNTLIHAGAALLLFGVLRRTLAPRIQDDAAGLALVIAAAWALHPLATQAVTYSVQRAESLMGFFYLLTLYAFVRGWFAASVMACALGMGTKEVMATAPLLVLLYDRTFVAGTFREAWRRQRTYYLLLGSTWLLLAALVASTGGNRGGTVGLGVGVPLWAYPLTQFEAVTRYLALGAWPQPLVFEYGTRWVKQAGDVLPYLAVVLPLLAATIAALRRWPAAGFCGAWFFAILAPTSLAPGTIQMIVEHRMYLPLAAVAALAGTTAYAWLGRRAVAAGAAAVVALAVLTAQRNRDYRSAVALWSDTVAKRPDNPRARDGLATALAAAGRLDAAIAQRAEVIRLKPDDAKYQYNFALNLAEALRDEEAIRHYEIAVQLAPDDARIVQLAPDDARIHNNLAVALVAVGRVEAALPHYLAAERAAPDAQFHYNHAIALTRLQRGPDAIAQYERALQLNPDFADAHLNLGTALVTSGRHDEGIAHYLAAVRLNANDLATRTTLGGALLVAGRVAEAEAQFRAALAAHPNAPDAHYGLANVAGTAGRRAEAIAEYETALRLAPDYANAHFKLANLLLDDGRLAEAVPHYQAAVRLAPDDAEAHHNLGIAFARLDRFSEAGREFETALRLKPDYADAQRHLAQVRTLLGR